MKKKKIGRFLERDRKRLNNRKNCDIIYNTYGNGKKNFRIIQ